MCTLLEKLLSGNYFSERNESDRLKHSICAHIEHMLNARKGALQHMPDYGLPDIQHICCEVPGAMTGFLEELVGMIERYEPRLRQVHIVHSAMYQEDFILLVCIEAMTYQNKRISLSANFKTDGCAYVQ